METLTSYEQNKGSQSVDTYLRWLQDEPLSQLKTVVLIAKRHHQPPLELEDLISEGNIGLLIALKEYKAEDNPIPIHDYITQRISAQIQDYIKHSDGQFLAEHERVEVDDMDLLPCKDRNIVNLLEIKDEGKAVIGVLNRVTSGISETARSVRNIKLFRSVYGLGYEVHTYQAAAKKFNLSEKHIKKIIDGIEYRLKIRLNPKCKFNRRDRETGERYPVKRFFISDHGFRWASESFYQ